MSGSGVLREKKQESVQFWLAIGAISLIFHALLIIGIKRWATIAVVDESEPIAVELVEPAGDSASAGEPIVQAAAMKPEIKPEAKPEVKPEPEPEIKSEVKPEPIVQPEVKKVEPAIVPKSETKPIVKKRKSSQTAPVPSPAPTSQIQSSSSPSPSTLPTVVVPQTIDPDDKPSVYVSVKSPAKLMEKSKVDLTVENGNLELIYPSVVDLPFSLKNQKSFQVLVELSVDTQTKSLKCYVSRDSPSIMADKKGVAEMIAQMCENTTYASPTFGYSSKPPGPSSSWTQTIEFQF